MRSRPAAVVALLALACAAAMSPATAAGASRACKAMAGKHVLKTSSIRVVSRQTHARTRDKPVTTYYGCDRAAGPVRRLGLTDPTRTRGRRSSGS